jgi:D-hydroxyproline dehydrogenase subunit beta
MRVLVIGAGAVGSCAALRLAETGADVTLVAGADPAASLSAHSFGWVNAINEGCGEYYDLSIAALDAHQRLAADTAGADQWLFPRGNLHWADDQAAADRLRDIAAGYRARGYPVAELTPEVVLRELEPGLRLDSVVGPVLFYPRDAHVLGDRLLAAVIGRARAVGLTVRIGDPVTALLGGTATGVVSGVRLASGETLSADAVVCCAGRGNRDLLAGLADLPLVEPDSSERLTRGLLVQTTPVPEPVRRIVHAPGLSIRPHSDHRLVLHCHDIDAQLSSGSDADRAAAEVLDRLPTVLPSARDAQVESVFLGVRPMPRDGMTIMGPVPGAESAYVVATHSGLTLAPVLGEIVAREVLGKPHPLASAFRLDRFATR